MKIVFENKKKKKPLEFSKKALAAMIVLWFFGAAVCMFVVLVQLIRGDAIINTSDLVTCVCAPITGGALGYMIKSALENREKIKKESSYEELEDEVNKP